MELKKESEREGDISSKKGRGQFVSPKKKSLGRLKRPMWSSKVSE